MLKITVTNSGLEQQVVVEYWPRLVEWVAELQEQPRLLVLAAFQLLVHKVLPASLQLLGVTS